MKKEYVNRVVKLLKKTYPNIKIPLKFKNPFQLLVAVILSAQCTDKRVNIVTENLFKKYKTIKDFADARLNSLEKDIHSTGFYKAKARNIQNSAKIILKKFSGKVPKNMNEILTLPGVARKTANVVLNHAYGVIEGIAVDTHVIRIANLLGLTNSMDPVKIEQDLMNTIPKNEWKNISLLIQLLGRTVCVARRQDCTNCTLKKICPSSSTKL
ncbi:endonuclease III [Elusimicrobiota bacterium]